MERGSWAYYLAILGASGFLSLVLTPVALRVALRGRMLDHPAERKAQESPVPYLGGVAIVGAFCASVIAATLAWPPPEGTRELTWVLGVAFGLSLVGLVDDLKSLGPLVRLLFEIGAGWALWHIGVGVELFPADWANATFTVLWVVGITNAFNLLDNMDGLSAGVSTIGALSFFAIGAANGQFLVAGLAIALAGCALGFLWHNFHPARIYMGDAGSLFLGFVLAYLGVKLRFDGPTSVTFLVPILVLGVPILDTALVTVCRLAARRSPFQGGLDHVSHRLVFIGIPVRAAVALVYAAGVSLGLTALVVSRIDRVSAYVLAGLAAAIGAFLAGLLARVPVYRGTDAWAPVDAGADVEPNAPESALRNRQARVGSLFGGSRTRD